MNPSRDERPWLGAYQQPAEKCWVGSALMVEKRWGGSALTVEKQMDGIPMVEEQADS